jgi:hypothetical protein
MNTLWEPFGRWLISSVVDISGLELTLVPLSLAANLVCEQIQPWIDDPDLGPKQLAKPYLVS